MIGQGMYNFDIREAFADEYQRSRPGEMLDLQGISFIADEPTIFGAVNQEYIDRELEWYQRMSLNVNDIPGGPPAIWQQVASKPQTPPYGRLREGTINSNYGYLFFHRENGSQFASVVKELKRDWQSRRAVAIYTRPDMHRDATRDGMQDFVCTNAVHYRVSPAGRVNATVQMRSNDAIFGYRNDFAWQKYALTRVATELQKEPGVIVWQAASLHIYPRHLHLVKTYIDSGVYDGSVTNAADD